MDRTIRIVVYVSAVAIALVAGPYLCKFGGGHWAPTISEWGASGDYFAGILNPLFAFGAFIGVLYTLKAQRQELEENRRSNRAGEIGPILNHIHTELLSRVRRYPPKNAPDAAQNPRKDGSQSVQWKSADDLETMYELMLRLYKLAPDSALLALFSRTYLEPLSHLGSKGYLDADGSIRAFFTKMTKIEIP